jgi:DNA polymerase-3 subunit gamma/tau
MRDSITCFDQVLAFCGSDVADEDVVTLVGVVDRRLLAEVSRAVFTRDVQAALDCVRQVDNAGYGIREFTRELIEHFRNLLIICSVGKPEEILDLAESELDDLKQQAAGQIVDDIQRQLALIIKAEASMLHASFPRLLLEMVLIKMASLQPVVPISQLMEQVRQLANRTDWTAAPVRQIAAPGPVKVEQAVPARPAVKVPIPLSPATETAPEPIKDPPASIKPVMKQQQQSTGSWEGLVEFCKSHNKPLLSSLLENGVPLRYHSDLVEVGFESDSYELSSMQDQDNRLELEYLASTYMGQPVRIKVSAVSPESGVETPGSLAEKKRLAAEQFEEELRREVHEHPLVQEALRVFEGEITEIRPLAKPDP